ncbi:hypothetical protein Sjap_010828 [Stephania japonica]|uniref:Uncharacterized protein n=1 Tax=Stephania japonica TaxID=461633 RepID=A0AAP0JA60_9MAGN
MEQSSAALNILSAVESKLQAETCWRLVTLIWNSYTYLVGGKDLNMIQEY